MLDLCARKRSHVRDPFCDRGYRKESSGTSKQSRFGREDGDEASDVDSQEGDVVREVHGEESNGHGEVDGQEGHDEVTRQEVDGQDVNGQEVTRQEVDGEVDSDSDSEEGDTGEEGDD